MFDLQPTLKGELLYLKPLKREDFESLYAVASDPLIWDQHPERLRYERERFQKFFDEGIASKGAFLVCDAKTNEVIGSSRYTQYNPETSSVEIGYTFLARKCWANGYNSEMKRIMIDHAFRFVGQVLFFIGETNFRSRKAVEKLGAKLIRRVEREHFGGVVHPAVIYGLSRN